MDSFGGTTSGTGLKKKWWGDKEPSDKTSIWYKGGVAYMYSDGEWVKYVTSGGDSGYDDVDGALYNAVYGLMEENYKASDDITYGPKIPDGFKFAPRTADHCAYMFAGNQNISKIDSFDTSKVWSVEGMFVSSSVTSIGLLDLSSVTVKIIETTDGSTVKVNGINLMLTGCPYLTDVAGFKDLGKGYAGINTKCELDLTSTNLTKESLVNIFNSVYDYGTIAGEEDYSAIIDLNSAQYRLITPSDEDIATHKGWWINVA